MKHSRNPSRSALRTGFTLLEILVGIVLMAILGLIIVQIVAATTRVTRLSNGGIDAASQARLAFDRLGLDLSSLIKRRDVDIYVPNSLGSQAADTMLFFSEVTSPGPASSNNRGASLIGYRINTAADSNTPCLVRGSAAMTWSGSNSQGITGYQANGLPNPISAQSISLSNSDYDVLAPAIIRVVIGFQLYPSGADVHLATGETLKGDGQIVYSPPVLFSSDGVRSSQVDQRAISSLVVGLVAINPEVLKLLDPAKAKDDINTLANCFPVPSAGVLPVSEWNAISENINSLPQSLPVQLRQSVRVFQRAFPIHPYGAMMQ